MVLLAIIYRAFWNFLDKIKVFGGKKKYTTQVAIEYSIPEYQYQYR